MELFEIVGVATLVTPLDRRATLPNGMEVEIARPALFELDSEDVESVQVRRVENANGDGGQATAANCWLTILIFEEKFLEILQANPRIDRDSLAVLDEGRVIAHAYTITPGRSVASQSMTCAAAAVLVNGLADAVEFASESPQRREADIP